MSSIVIKGNTSGQIELAAPDVAGSTTLTLPTGSGNVIKDDGSGNVTLSGNITPSGIYLGGTGSANLLDDYEEGTFTPGWTGSTGAPTISYSEQHGYYIKVGDLVTVWGFILVSSISGGGGQIWITGLPFAVADTIPATTIDGGGALNYFTNWGSSRSYISASPINGSATMRLYQIAGGGGKFLCCYKYYN